MAMMAITTSNSMSVKALCLKEVFMFCGVFTAAEIDINCEKNWS
jgi:hypothetical protein